LIDVSGTPFTMGAPATELGRDTDEVEHAARGGTTTATYNGNLDETNGTFNPFSCDPNPELEMIAWWCVGRWA
jgi:hypothetical protein